LQLFLGFCPETGDGVVVNIFGKESSFLFPENFCLL
jgi:hypothetical protein